MVPDHALVEDSVQETILTVIKKPDSFELGTNFRAWVFATARFKLMTVSRLLVNRETCLSEDVLKVLLNNSEEDFQWDKRAEFLLRCLGKLSPRAREVIELRYFSELNPPEIAKTICWSIGGVNVALTRARQMLASCIKAEIDQLRNIFPCTQTS